MLRLTATLALACGTIAVGLATPALADDSPPAAETPAAARTLAFDLQTRDENNRPLHRRTQIDSRRVGLVIVDSWNYHWCMTAAQRCGTFAERFNRAAAAARQLGMTVCWCPTDVADQYVGTLPRERAVALPRADLPKSLVIPFRELHCFKSNGCVCGPGIECQDNYGWDAMHPALRVCDDDFIPEGTEELYSVCRERGLTHLIYLGFHTNVCTTGKPVGIRAMANAGLVCILARDMTDAISGYDPAAGQHPDRGTREVIEQLETQVPTVELATAFDQAGLWPRDELLDPVRIVPWGTTRRPYLFERSTTVTLSTPLQPGARIHYTLDGSEPSPASPMYEHPLPVQDTVRLRAAAFDPASGRPVCRESEAALVRLPRRPPAPDVKLVDLKPVRATCCGYHAFGSTKQPRLNQGYTGGELKIRGQTYEHGLGVQAPSQLVYGLKPEYRRFVAQAGIDETVRADDNGRAIAMHPSVTFEVWIDGRVAAKSPVMRFQHEPWRFDVELPAGARQIHLVASAAEDGHAHDLALWVNAGFTRE